MCTLFTYLRSLEFLHHGIIYTSILKSDYVCSVKGVVTDPDTTLPSKHLGPLL